MATIESPIFQTIAPVTHDLGGFKVHRTLPSKPRTMVGPFIFFDQMGPAKLAPGQGIDVRPHPHINLATVTYLFAGAIDHRDSLGTVQRIEPGAVNLMTAGSGIAHSERSPGEERAAGAELDGIQTWLALPKAKEEVAPGFEHVPDRDLPIVEGDGVHLQLIMGEGFSVRSPVTQHSPTIYAAIKLAPGAAMVIDHEADERALYLLEGDASVDGTPLVAAEYVADRSGLSAVAVVARRRAADAVRRSADGRRTPRLVELRVLEPRPDQRGQARLAGRRVRASARRP